MGFGSLATTSNASSGNIPVYMWLCEFIFCDIWLNIVGIWTYYYYITTTNITITITTATILM